MPIIYSYPTKSTPAGSDLLLISDSEDNNSTRTISITSLLAGAGGGGGTNITLTTTGTSGASTLSGTGALNIPVYGGIADGFSPVKVSLGTEVIQFTNATPGALIFQCVADNSVEGIDGVKVFNPIASTAAAKVSLDVFVYKGDIFSKTGTLAAHFKASQDYKNDTGLFTLDLVFPVESTLSLVSGEEYVIVFQTKTDNDDNRTFLGIKTGIFPGPDLDAIGEITTLSGTYVENLENTLNGALTASSASPIGDFSRFRPCLQFYKKGDGDVDSNDPDGDGAANGLPVSDF